MRVRMGLVKTVTAFVAALVVGMATSVAAEDMTRCQVCIYTLERIKNGYTYLLPNICEELNAKYPGTDGAPKPLYGQCMALLSGMSQWGADVKHWWHFGCYKVEDYGAMELIQPCPTHAVCAKITDLNKVPFCEWPKSDSDMEGLKSCKDEKCGET